MKKLPESVMIVEDEAITQRYLKEILAQLGIKEIEGFETAQKAREAFSKKEYEMVLMDINLEGAMDGIQLTRELLAKRSVPVIFITAHSDEETMEEVLELSPFGFITKPFSAKNVEVTLRIAYTRFYTEQGEKERHKYKTQSDQVDISGIYSFSRSMRQLFKNGEIVELNAKHRILLRILCDNLDRTVTYEQLIREIWGDTPVADSALRTLVWTLRKRLPDLPLFSQSRVGYVLKKS